MDEHDKRALEVAERIHREVSMDPVGKAARLIAPLLRSTAAAAERRIAARLLARADEEERRDVVALTDLDARIARAQARAVAAVLRSEADTLEGT